MPDRRSYIYRQSTLGTIQLKQLCKVISQEYPLLPSVGVLQQLCVYLKSIIPPWIWVIFGSASLVRHFATVTIPFVFKHSVDCCRSSERLKDDETPSIKAWGNQPWQPLAARTASAHCRYTCQKGDNERDICLFEWDTKKGDEKLSLIII